MTRKATVCEKLVTIPTYAAGMMEKNPMFLEKTSLSRLHRQGVSA